MEAAKGMVVKTRNRLVMQLQLKKLLQGPDQPVKTYLASLKSVARTCKFQVKCTEETWLAQQWEEQCPAAHGV